MPLLNTAHSENIKFLIDQIFSFGQLDFLHHLGACNPIFYINNDCWHLPIDTRAMVKTASSFKGNKRNLPSKPCQVCGREMTWRKSWAKNWQDVKYCSDACRKYKTKINTQ